MTDVKEEDLPVDSGCWVIADVVVDWSIVHGCTDPLAANFNKTIPSYNSIINNNAYKKDKIVSLELF